MHDGIARQDAEVLLAVGRPCAQHVCARHSAVLLSSCRSAASSCSGTWRMAVARRDGACKLSTQLRVLSLRARGTAAQQDPQPRAMTYCRKQ